MMRPLFLMLAALPAAAPMVAIAAGDELPTTRAGVDAAVIARFRVADANHDGQIDRREAAAALGLAADALSRRPASGPLFDLQTGSDGRPQIAMREDGPLGAGGMIDMAYTAIDHNGDDRLSLAEVRGEALARFDAADRDHDGTLNPDELHRARAQLGMMQRSLMGGR